MTDDYLELDAKRERILLAGFPGSGKTYALLGLADMIGMADPKAKIWVLDADRGFGKIQKQEWPQVKGLDYRVAREWDDVEAFVEEVSALQTDHDWIFIDMIGRFWEMAQSLEVAAVHGLSMGRKMLQARKELVEQAKLQAPGSLPQPDWTVIKRLHNDEFIDRLTAGWDANIIATTSLDPLDTSRDDQLLVSIFAQYGFKPDGEKRNSHRFDTVLFLSLLGKKRELTTIKDRARPLLNLTIQGTNLFDEFKDALAEKNYAFAGGVLG